MKIFLSIFGIVVVLGIGMYFLFPKTSNPQKDSDITGITFPVNTEQPQIPQREVNPEITSALQRQAPEIGKVTYGGTVIVPGYALQTWWDNYTGGEALLKYIDGEWKLLPGSGPWNVESLITAGVPVNVASQLTKRRSGGSN